MELSPILDNLTIVPHPNATKSLFCCVQRGARLGIMLRADAIVVQHDGIRAFQFGSRLPGRWPWADSAGWGAGFLTVPDGAGYKIIPVSPTPPPGVPENGAVVHASCTLIYHTSTRSIPSPTPSSAPLVPHSNSARPCWTIHMNAAKAHTNENRVLSAG